MTTAILWLLITVPTGDAPQGWYFETERECWAVARWMNESPDSVRQYGCRRIYPSPFILQPKE